MEKQENCVENTASDAAPKAYDATDVTKNLKMYYINLDKRKDRCKQMADEFADVLPEHVSLHRWPATQNTKGWIGCIQSHAAVLKHLSNEDKSGFDCVLEDDCKINNRDTFKELFPKYITYLKEHRDEWDLFLGGGIYVSPTRIVCRDPFIIECSWIACSHFVIYNDTSAKKVITYAEGDKHDVGIDNFNARSNRNRIWVPYPLLCDQYNDDTDIGNFKEYLERIRNGFKDVHSVLDAFVLKEDKASAVDVKKEVVTKLK